MNERDWLRKRYEFGKHYGMGAKRLQEILMKTCHACGQKLPLKVGDVVARYPMAGETRKTVTGIVTGLVPGSSSCSVNILSFDGSMFVSYPKYLTRLHGYYRITSREPLA